MEEIALHDKTTDGTPVEAVFCPGGGMNLIRFRLGDIDLIDPHTRNLYEERFAGLGAMIGPHFHHRIPEIIPPVPSEERFPHIARLRKKGIKEPFSHGIARYAPWKAERSGQQIQSILTGRDEWMGVPLAQLEGQDFVMHFSATLEKGVLSLSLSVVSDTNSVVGFHYYWHKMGKTTLSASVQPEMIAEGKMLPIPADWGYHEGKLSYSVGPDVDVTFHPSPDPLQGDILLDTEAYALAISYTSPSQENAWQCYHPKEASYVCIEPVSAKDPRHPILSVSEVHMSLRTEEKKNLEGEG